MTVILKEGMKVATYWTISIDFNHERADLILAILRATPPAILILSLFAGLYVASRSWCQEV